MSGISSQMIFSPQRCTLERLDQTLTPSRRRLANQIVEQYESVASQGGSHYMLLTGPRGAGKTHLLAYVAKRLAESDKGASIRIIVLPEEERSIARPFDFVLACLRAARQPEDALRAKLRGADPSDPWGNVVPLFREVIGNEAALIIAENLADVFDGLGEDGLPVLRALFQELPNVSLLASTISLYEESRSPDHPFYGFFQIVPVRPLTVKEAQQFLCQLAHAENDLEMVQALSTREGAARVKAIFDLTGGNPRLLAMLNAFLDARNIGDLVEPFVQLADRELTPYYQQRLDRLSPTQNKIVQAIAMQEGVALNVTQIAEYAHISPQVTSRALNDLMQCGLIRRNPRGRESYYELNEPLLRLVLDLKAMGDGPLRLIVETLRRWYDTDELRKLSVQAPQSSKRYYNAAALSHFKCDPEMSKVLATIAPDTNFPDDSTLDYLEFVKHANLSDQHFKNGQLIEAVAQIDTAISYLRKVDDSSPSFHIDLKYPNKSIHSRQQVYASALLLKWEYLIKLDRNDEALAVCDEVQACSDPNQKEQASLPFATSFVCRAATLWKQKRIAEAIQSCDDLLNRYEISNDEQLNGLIRRALGFKGSLTEELGRFQEAISIYRALIDRYPPGTEDDLEERAASTLLRIGILHGKLNQLDESLAAYDELVRRFQNSLLTEVREHVANGLLNKVSNLIKLNRLEDVIMTCEYAIDHFKQDECLEIRVVVYTMSLHKSAAQAHLGQLENANVSVGKLLEELRDAREPELVRSVAVAHVLKSIIAAESKDFDEALEYAERAYKLLRDESMVLIQYTECLFKLGRTGEGFRVLEECLKKIPESDGARSDLFSEVLGSTLHNRALLQRVIQLFRDDHKALSSGLVEWLKSKIPFTQESAEKLGELESLLRDVFRDIPGTQETIRMLAAARRDAMGDTRALLELPLELRRLVKPELHLEDEE